MSGVRKADQRSRRRRLLNSSTNSGRGLSPLVFDASIVESSPFMVAAERRVNSLAIFELYYDFWGEFNLLRHNKKPFASIVGLNYKYH